LVVLAAIVDGTVVGLVVGTASPVVEGTGPVVEVGLAGTEGCVTCGFEEATAAFLAATRRSMYLQASATEASVWPARSACRRKGSTEPFVTSVTRMTVGSNHRTPPGRPWKIVRCPRCNPTKYAERA
jgi:hypothetical protein